MQQTAISGRGTLAILLSAAAVACGTADPMAGFSVSPAATSATGGFTASLDTVPSSDGATFYFVATGADGKPGVFKVLASGGAATSVAAGAPLMAPVGIAISGDDKTLYVADRTAGIFKLAAAGGTPSVLAGTETSHPRGLEVAARSGADVIYFTGDETGTGTAGVFTIAASGGAVSTLAKGSPFLQPTGVAVAKNGDVYVSNPATFGPHPALSTVLKISGGAVTVVASGLALGYPAGVALDQSNTALLISGLDVGMSHAVVYAVDLASGQVAMYTRGIDQNAGAGGLHRAAQASLYGWCGTTGPMGGGAGTVFQVKL